MPTPKQNKIVEIPTAAGVENATVKEIERIYRQQLTKALNQPDIKAALNDIENIGKGDFQLTRQMERELDKIRLELNQKLNVSIVNGVTASWINGEKTAGVLVQAQYGQTTQSIAKVIADRATSSARQAGKTAHNFTLQKTNGLNISNRVWNCNANFKSEMTAIIQNSMLQGMSAHQTALQVQKYLKNPTALYRRVRNKQTGELELSAAARKYHPGRGVYRSAYKNAMRLARTEINVAYRQAEWESYQRNPLVSGFEIRLSGNHTCLVKGIPRPFVDICDYKAGKYPKTFQWHGWHPQCRCIMIPIVMKDDEFVKFLTEKDAKNVNRWIKPSADTEAWLKELEEREVAYRNEKNEFISNMDKIKQLSEPTSVRLNSTFEPFSPIIMEKLRKLKKLREREKLFEDILKLENFEIAQQSNNITLLHPLHKTNGNWQETLNMAKSINDDGDIVAFLPEYDRKISADAITKINGKYKVVDFKYCISTKYNTIQDELHKAFIQAEGVVIQLVNADLGIFKDAIDYLKRNNLPIKDFKILNKYGKILDLSRNEFIKGTYLKKMRGFL